MATPTDRKCPSCGWFSLVGHCTPGEDTNCDLVRCDRCKSFGQEAGPRWVDRDEEPAA